MPNPASIADLEARWRPLVDQEVTNAVAFLGDAWAELVSRRPSLEADVTAGTVSEDNVIRVVCAMVLRLLKNPDGWDQESIDDWSGRRNALVADGVLRVTADELASVTPGRAIRRSVRLVVYGDA
jgi:hypothetical protein